MYLWIAALPKIIVKHWLKIYCVVSLLLIVGLCAGFGYMAYHTQREITNIKGNLDDISNNQSNQSTLTQQDIENAANGALNVSNTDIAEKLDTISNQLDDLLSRYPH